MGLPSHQQLRITSEQPADNGVLPAPDTLIDLTPLDTNGNGTRSQMAVTVTAAPAMDRSKRGRLLREALAYMVRQFGYVDAEVGML